jgi:heptosyltransferase-2
MYPASPPARRKNAPRRLLVRGTNWLGDAVMTAPTLQRLRTALPETHITLLTRAKLADLWSGHPDLDEVICIAPGKTVWQVGRRLRAEPFDTALVLPNSPRSALEIFLAGIPRRIGYRRAWRNWFLTEAIPTRAAHVTMRKRSAAEVRQLVDSSASSSPNRPSLPVEAHQLHDYLHLAETLIGPGSVPEPRLHVNAAEIEEARTRFDVPGKYLWMGLNAGAEYGPAKRWPLNRFLSAAKVIHERLQCSFLVFGGPGDVETAGQLARELGTSSREVRDVSGRTNLRELMALLSCCRVLLTNDTGPMHVAAALDVPVVVPFGSTSPELTGPGRPGAGRHALIQSDVPCSPCFLRECPIDFRCMEGISVDRVVSAVTRAVASDRATG